MNRSHPAVASQPARCLVLAVARRLGGGGDGSVGNPPPAGTLPTATLTAPADLAAGLTGMVVVSATANDDVAVTGVEFQIDGVTIGAVDTTAPYAVTVDTSLYTSGQHVLRARASDAAGNVSAWSTALVHFAGSVSQPSGFTRDEAWITGLSGSTAFAQAPDGRIFVTQQEGAIRVIKDGVLLPTPFATVTVDSTGERGLLGIALHPDFAQQRLRLHLLDPHRRRIAQPHQPLHRRRRRRGGRQRDRPGGPAQPVERGSFTTAAPSTSAATASSTSASATTATRCWRRTSTSPFGKLLRFNEDGTIPTDNPYYATQSGLARAVWASGLRNPFTFAVQPGTGRIHINDVGQDTWEEINLGVAGANYGWPYSEGPTDIVVGSTASPRRCSPIRTAIPTRSARARAASSPAPRSPAAPSIRRAVRSPRATATSTTSPISSASSSAGSTLPTAMRCIRSPSFRPRRSTCWWASTARSTC